MTENKFVDQKAVSLLQNRKSVVDLVYGIIKDAILSGKYPMGMVLNQVALAKELGVSRAPIREALRRLQAEDLVVISPNKQVLVASIYLDLYRDIMVVREILECNALRLAFEHWEEIDFDKLIHLEEQMKKELRTTEHLKLNREWHAVFTHAAGNQYLAQLIDGILQNNERMYYAFGKTYPRIDLTSQEHKAIREAMLAKNFNLAEELLKSHIQATYEHLASSITEKSI